MVAIFYDAKMKLVEQHAIHPLKNDTGTTQLLSDIEETAKEKVTLNGKPGNNGAVGIEGPSHKVSNCNRARAHRIQAPADSRWGGHIVALSRQPCDV